VSVQRTESTRGGFRLLQATENAQKWYLMISSSEAAPRTLHEINADSSIPFAALARALCHHNLESIIKRHNPSWTAFLAACGLPDQLADRQNGRAHAAHLLLDLFRLVIRKTDKAKLDHPDRKDRSKVHQGVHFFAQPSVKKMLHVLNLSIRSSFQRLKPYPA